MKANSWHLHHKHRECILSRVGQIMYSHANDFSKSSYKVQEIIVVMTCKDLLFPQNVNITFQDCFDELTRV